MINKYIKFCNQLKISIKELLLSLYPKLNDMNKKIDNLYEMIYKLTNLMEKNNNTEIVEVNDISN